MIFFFWKEYAFFLLMPSLPWTILMFVAEDHDFLHFSKLQVEVTRVQDMMWIYIVVLPSFIFMYDVSENLSNFCTWEHWNFTRLSRIWQFSNRIPTPNNLVRWGVFQNDEQLYVGGCGDQKNIDHLFLQRDFFGKIWSYVSH